MKDIYELLNDVNIDVDDFIEMEVDEVERKRVKKALKSSIRKKRSYRSKKSMVASLALIVPILLGITVTAYGDKIPFLDGIFKNMDFGVEPIYENYKEYATPLNITKESNGIKVTINEAIYDGTTLNYNYTIESNRDLGDNPVIGLNSLGSNIESQCGSSVSGGGSLERVEGNTYVGHESFTFDEPNESMNDSIKFNINWKDIAIVNGPFWQGSVNGEIEYEGDILEVIKGSWDFNIEIKAIENKVITVDKSTKRGGLQLTVDTISLSPISTQVKFIEKSKNGINHMVYSNFIIEIEDDLGNKYVQRDHGGYSDSYSKTRMVALNKIDENATKLIIKVEAADEGLLDGNEIEKTFEPIIIDIKND